MNSMKKNLINTIGEKVAVKIGEASIRLGEKSVDKCFLGFFYEPKISIELLKSSKDK